jgi:hypothetical protein
MVATWKHRGGDDWAATESLTPIYNTIHLAVDCGFQSMILESDNETVIQLVDGTAQLPRTYMGTLI